MDPRQITRLAKLLRENGDKILSSEYKITLTGSLLRSLNDSFGLITDPNEVCTPRTFQVLKPNNGKSDVFRELQIIYDFVQKSQVLCLTTIPTEDHFDGIIDITKFRNLRRLEVQRIPIQQIVGIQRLRAHLRDLICTCKCIDSIESIVSHCGGDNANGFLWNELQVADFSYNRLQTIDCSLEFVSNLQQLNLSHNNIVSVDAIRWLPNLKKLNLSFNSLTQIPQHIVSRRLQTLNLSNNFIEDLSGLPKLEALNELNVSDNCILDHGALAPLQSLIALQHLQLHGNPIACHEDHRTQTVQYLHKNTKSEKFVLDFQTLSRFEHELIGVYDKWRKPRNAHVKASAGQRAPLRRFDITPASSIGSMQSYTLDNKLDVTLANDPMNTSQTSLTAQKRIKARQAIIADDDIEIINEPKTDERKPDIMDVSANQAHLEMMKKIEDIRHEHGDGWLQSQSAIDEMDRMGIPTTSNPLTMTKTPEQFLDEICDTTASSGGHQRMSTPVEESNLSTSPSAFQSPISSHHDYLSLNSSDQRTNSTENTTYKSTNSNDDELNKFYGTGSASTTIDEFEHESDDEGSRLEYIVTNESNQMTLFLVIADKSIREKNVMTARRINRWNIDMLESCERIRSDTIRIRFDTLKKDKKERTFRMEPKECQELDEYLRNILSNRSLSEMNQIVFRCISCNAKFSRERPFRTNRQDKVECPECSCSYVVEIHEHQSVVAPSLPVKADELLKSESQASVDTASSCNERLSQSFSQSSFDSNQSLIGSATNANDLDVYFSSRFGGPPESDVEILSNPSLSTLSSIEVLEHFSPHSSISSVEVLDRFSRQSSRKQSDDMRSLLQTQLYVQQLQHQQPPPPQPPHRPNRSSDGSDVVSLSFDVLAKSTSNSDIEDILDDPAHDSLTVQHVTVSQTDGKTAESSDDTAAAAGEAYGHKLKKPLLTGMNLTESSSSGSVTDSICTAYENNTSGTPHKSEQSTSMTSTATITSDASPTVSSKQTKDSSPNESDLSKTDDTSSISTMFGGLFNSTTNLLMQRGSKLTPVKPRPPPCEPYTFSYEDFSNVDHRLKLYLYQNIFEDNNEHLKWLIKGLTFTDAANTDAEAALQPAIFVMSTTKWYVLNEIGPQSDNIAKWLRRDAFGTIDRVEMVRVLPWKVGITFTIKYVGKIHFLLQDIGRTDSLLLFFANNPLPRYCDLEYQISERISQKLLQVTENVQLKMFAILGRCKIIEDDDSETLCEHGAFIVTDTHLYLTTAKYAWLMDKTERRVEVARAELMTDLVEVDNVSGTTFAITFLDEIHNQKQVWHCAFETDSCLQNTLAAIAQSWEKLFKVPLISSNN